MPPCVSVGPSSTTSTRGLRPERAHRETTGEGRDDCRRGLWARACTCRSAICSCEAAFTFASTTRPPCLRCLSPGGSGPRPRVGGVCQHDVEVGAVEREVVVAAVPPITSASASARAGCRRSRRRRDHEPAEYGSYSRAPRWCSAASRSSREAIRCTRCRSRSPYGMGGGRRRHAGAPRAGSRVIRARSAIAGAGTRRRDGDHRPRR